MNEIIQIAIVVAVAALIATPLLLVTHLERIQRQNERIISLLVDLKAGRKEF